MRDPARINRIVEKLQAYWQTYPDLRFGQVVAICAPRDADLFYVEDDQIEAGIDAAINVKE